MCVSVWLSVCHSVCVCVCVCVCARARASACMLVCICARTRMCVSLCNCVCVCVCVCVYARAQQTCRIQSRSVLVPASYGHSGQQATEIGPDCIRRIQFPTSDSDAFWGHRKRPGSSLLDPNETRFYTSGPVPVWMRYPGSQPEKQIRTASVLSAQCRMHHLNQILFCTSGPVLVSMSYYPGSALTERSRIQPDSRQTLAPNQSFLFRAGWTTARSEPDPFFLLLFLHLAWFLL